MSTMHPGEPMPSPDTRSAIEKGEQDLTRAETNPALAPSLGHLAGTGELDGAGVDYIDTLTGLDQLPHTD